MLSGAVAQDPVPKVYKEPESGISFNTWNVPGSSGTGGLTFGMALPSTALKDDATEFVGYLVSSPDSQNFKRKQRSKDANKSNNDKHCAAKNASTADGWCGISLGGSMTDSLLLVAYPDGNDVRTSLRITSSYTMPDVYTGNATVTQVGSAINATGFSLTFHCQDCLHWAQNGTTGSAATSGGMLDFGYAQALEPPRGNLACAGEMGFAQHDSHGTWTALLEDSIASESYGDWRKLANHTVPSRCKGDNK